MEILGYRQYYEEAIEALEEIGSILDYNTNARCESGRRDLVSHVRHYKLNDGQYRRLYEQAQKDAEHFRDEANAYEAKWRAVLEKYEDIRDTDWYTKIKDQEKQIDCQKDAISRQLAEIKRLEEENKRLQDVINRLKPASDAAEVIGLKIEINSLKNKLAKIKIIAGDE